MILLQQWGGDIGIEYHSTTTTAIFVIFSIIMVGIGIVAARYQTDRTEYFVAGRRSGVVIIALSVYAALISGWGALGFTGSTYLIGPEFLAILNFVVLGTILTYWLLARKMRTLGNVRNAISVPEAMYYRFGKNDRVRMLGAVSVILGCLGYLSAQYAAMGIVLSLILPVDFFTAVVVGLVIVGFYTVIGGMLAALWSDAIQGAILLTVSILSFIFVATNYPGGTSAMIATMQNADPNYFNFTALGSNGNMSWGIIISLIVIGLTVTGQPQVISKFYMVKNVEVLKWGSFITAFSFVATFLLYAVGIFARSAVESGIAQAPQTPDASLIVGLLEFSPDIFVGIALTGIVAAIMSTSNAFLNLAASAVTYDYMIEYKGRNLSDSQEVKVSRLVTFSVLVLAGVLSAAFPGLIFALGAAGWALFAVVIVPGVAIAYNWKGATSEGILWGGGVGLVLTIGLAYGTEFLGYELPYGFLGGQVATILSVLVFIGVSLITDTDSYNSLNEDIQEILDLGRIRGRWAGNTDIATKSDKG